MSIERVQTNHLTWINIDQPDASSIEYLRENFKFHQLNLEDTLDLSEVPKVDVYRHYLFIVLHFPSYDRESHRIVIRELNLFVTRDHLITIPEKSIPSLTRFFDVYTHKAPKNHHAPYKNTTGYLVYKIINRLFREVDPIIDHLSRDITQLEEQIYGEEVHERRVREIASLRRNVLTLRRILDPQRTLIRTIGLIRRPFLPEELENYFDDVRDTLDRMWHLLGSHLEFLEGISESFESILRHRTNKVINSLTVISVSLLPPTLLASMYGMNIDLPFGGHPWAFWIVVLAMLGFEVIIFSFFRKKHWL